MFLVKFQSYEELRNAFFRPLQVKEINVLYAIKTDFSFYVPNLRFEGFAEEWEKEIISNKLLNFRLGGNYKNTLSFTENPLIKMGNIHRGYINLDKVEFIVKNENINEKDKIHYGDLFFNTRNTLELVGKVAIWRNELPLAYYNSNLMKLSFEDNFFMNYWFNTKIGIKKLRQLATGTTSVAAIYTKDLLKIKFNIPSFEEQQKITSFLTKIDNRISTQRELIRDYELLKKGLMQKIFKQEIRFKDENGNEFSQWQKKRLKEVLNYEQPTKYLVSHTEYDNNFKTPVLTAGKTFLLGFTDDINGVFEDNLPTIIFDDFTTAFKYVDFPFKAKSSAMKMLIKSDENVNIKFVYEAMKTIKFPLGEHKRYWISEFQHIKIPYPSRKEQQKIAKTLSTIDRKITVETNYLEELKAQKQYLLQNMFV